MSSNIDRNFTYSKIEDLDSSISFVLASKPHIINEISFDDYFKGYIIEKVFQCILNKDDEFVIDAKNIDLLLKYLLELSEILCREFEIVLIFTYENPSVNSLNSLRVKIISFYNML